MDNTHMDNLDDILKRAAETPHPVDPAVLDRIAKSIEPGLRPVRPIAPPWLLTSGLALITVAIAMAGAAKLGLYGFQNLPVLHRAVIYPVLALLIWMAAASSVSEMIPGSRRLLSPGFLLGAGSLLLLAVFALLFRDYQTINFLPQGIACLTAGLLHAAPTAFAIWFVLRRGFAVNPVSAGTVAGTLAGLAGITMLELHCPNFEAFHVMLWHTAVVVISGGAGALLAALFNRR
jgi:hypothetical protein